MLKPPDAAAAAKDQPLDHRRVVIIVLGVLLPMFLGALDLNIVATALPAIATSLNDFDNISWTMTAYLLAGTVVTPLYGKLSDIYGRRGMMLFAIALVMVGSVVSALAPNMLVLIIGRTLQGLGGGGTIPLSQTIVAEITTPMERPKYQSYTSTMFMVASVGGPVLGGLIADYLHWSVIFWLNLPLGVAALVITYVVLRHLPRHDRPHKLDVLGAMLMMTAGLTLMLAMTWGGKRYPWLSLEVGALVVGSALLWALFAWRVTVAPEPFVPLSVLRNRIVRNSMGLAFFGVGLIIGLTILVPLYFKIGLGLSATLSGVAVIAIQSGATLSSIGATYMIVRVLRYRRIPLAGILLAVIFLAVLVIEPFDLPLPVIIVVITMIGIGLGPLFSMSIITIQNVIAPRQLGVATGVSSFFRSLGGTFIVAGFGAIVLGSAQGGGAMAVVDPDVFRWVFAAAIGCLLATAAFLYGIEERPWRGPGELLEADG